MKQFIAILFLVTLSYLTAWSQEVVDPNKTLSSEELYKKQGNSSRALGTPGQKYVVLDASPALGGFHRYRFFPGDQVKFRMKNETIRFNETLISVKDSSFTIGTINEALSRMEYQDVLLKDIRLMKVSRNIPFVTQAAYLLPFAGLIYVGADFFNKGVDNKRFTTDKSAVIVGGAFVVTGLFCYKISFSSLKINHRNKLKVLETY